jgi:hypothetical protein
MERVHTLSVALPRSPLPPMALLRRSFDATHIPELRAEVCQRLRAFGLRLERGARVGITAGSRDMGGFVQLLQGIADAIRQEGAIR